MKNLRIVNTKVESPTQIVIEFNQKIKLISKSNFYLRPVVDGVPTSEVESILISDNFVYLTTDYLTPYSKYEIILNSSENNPILSENNEILSIVTNDKIYILGYEDVSEPVRNNLLRYLENGIRSIDEPPIRDFLNCDSKDLSQILFDIKELYNDVFLEKIISNEIKVRGAGPYDRLNEGGAFEIIKVSKNLEPNFKTLNKKYKFKNNPISLQSVEHSETLISGIKSGCFDQLMLRLSKYPVSKLLSLKIVYKDSTIYNFPIESLFYQLKDSRYDENGSDFVLLEKNEILLTEEFEKYAKIPTNGDLIYITYEYLNLGRSVNQDSVNVYNILKSIREVCPPITTYFTLNHAPVVDVNGIVPELNGIQFLDPQANLPFSTNHLAFLKEKKFDLNSLPQFPGEYSVDYVNGKVFVYGEDFSGNGTGKYPPVCSYYYKSFFEKDLDFVFDNTKSEITTSSKRNLIGNEAILSFEYEDLLIPGIDFNPQIHKEVINERIDNRIFTTNTLKTKFSPITNVFRLTNETTGEVYSIQRWNDYFVYFSSKIPPRVKKIIQENVNFSSSNNETLFVSEEYVNMFSTIIFKIQLQCFPIIGSSEDCIGSLFNSSVKFTDKNIFKKELYFDKQESIENNLNRLSVGQYLIDYEKSIIYVAVNSTSYDIGSISYLYGKIETHNKHIIAVDNLFYSNSTTGLNKKNEIIDFSDTQVSPKYFEISDERFLNDDISQSYTLSLSNNFVVTDNVDFVRNLYDLYDLKNNIDPVNFSNSTVISGKTITVFPVEKQLTGVINNDLSIQIPPISNGIDIVEIINVIGNDSKLEYWDGYGSLINNEIILSGANSPIIGENVTVKCKLMLNGASIIVVDYSRGNYLIDYTYLIDELLISYEYGNNLLDFRKMSKELSIGETYYVTYKVGGLRNALLNNFGSLFDIPSINYIDLNISREVYRDILMGAVGSITKGPTVPALKELIKQITHVQPDLIEAVFDNWSLGSSYLNPNQIKIKDEFLSLPAVSNFRIEEGTFETWVVPSWNGIDNDAELTFSFFKNGNVLSTNNIFVGKNNFSPILNSENKFSISKNNLNIDVVGKPSKIFTEDCGIFVFFDEELNVWKVLAKDSVNITNIYSGKIETSGDFYDVKNVEGLGEINDVLRSGKKTIEFEFNIDQYDALNADGYDGYIDGYISGYSFDGISFRSDLPHYIFDFGKIKNKNRLSVFKDGSGYLVFQCFDKFGIRSELSYNIQNWKSSEKHYIGTSWKLNTVDSRDEMHLFVDGLEIPNVLKYGNRPPASTNDKYRSIGSETIIYTAVKPSIFNDDLNVVSGSTFVTSSKGLNFENLNVVIGDTIKFINPNIGNYTIVSVNFNTLELDNPIGITLNDVIYSINPVETVVSTKVALYTNIALYVVSPNETETEIPGQRAKNPGYKITKNDLNQDVILFYGNLEIGDSVIIKTLGLNHRRVLEKIYLWNDSSIIKTQLPEPISLDEVQITAVLLSAYVIGPNSSVGPGIFIGSTDLTQPTNNSEGRTLSVKINGGNINFSTPVQVVINGTIYGGGTSEILTFSSNEIKTTIGKFLTTTNVIVSVVPLVSTKDFLTIEVFESSPITVSEDNDNYPIIKYSYVLQTGNTLVSDGFSNLLVDENANFLDSVVGQILSITSGTEIGFYLITERPTINSIRINSILSSFNNIEYKIYYSGVGNSAYQNGYFTFLNVNNIEPYILPKGFYKFDYSTYFSAKFDPLTDENIYFGTDLLNKYHSNSKLNEIRILSKKITDIRVGEFSQDGQEYISKNFEKRKKFIPNKNTLTLIHTDEEFIKNSAKFYISFDKKFIQSGNSINANFNQSLFIDNDPIIIDNDGVLNNNSGTVEFWVSPKYDTINDPKIRYYFDATSFEEIEVNSISKNIIILPNRVLSIHSVLFNGTNYECNLLKDQKTIVLSKPLPYEKTSLKVFYLPLNLNGDRISIYKDIFGKIVFEIIANKEIFQLKSPIVWDRNSWHRVSATFTCNNLKTLDKMELFIDGNESGIIKFGSGLLFGQGNVFGQSYSGPTSITGNFIFTDPINEIYLGSDFRKTNICQSRIDNLRISNIQRIFWNIAGQKKDLNYNQNLKNVYPVVEDLYTTYLLDFNSLVEENNDLAVIRNETGGLFNFTLDIIDSFDILSGNQKVKQITESLIKLFKPARSKVKINYLK